MECRLLSSSQIERYLNDGMNGTIFNSNDYQFTFNTTISVIQALEQLKKKNSIQYGVMLNNLKEFCDSGLAQLDLNQYEMVKALESSEFIDKYTSRTANPFDITTLLSIEYNEDCWGDVAELLSQL